MSYMPMYGQWITQQYAKSLNNDSSTIKNSFKADSAKKKEVNFI